MVEFDVLKENDTDKGHMLIKGELVDYQKKN